MPEINVQNISFSYGKHSIFNGYDLRLSGSGIYTLIGPSGCGKTTLLRLLLGLERPSSGRILLSEQPAAAFQEYRLFPHMTAVENVAVIRTAPRAARVSLLRAAKELLISFGFTEDEFALYPSELSGGMKQRVALSRALFSESSILILDEPSKELDGELREVLYDKLTERGKKALIILTTHRPEETERLGATSIRLS